MAIAVFDADVLIGFLGREDAHHARAVERMRAASRSGMTRALCAVTYSEVLAGPARRGVEVLDQVRTFFDAFAFTIVVVDRTLAEAASTVRASTGLRLPDAFVLATALARGARGASDVRVETFDGRLERAAAALLPG